MPQERNIFRSLTVDENLTAVALPGPWTPHKVYEMFPRLGERKSNLGNQLSGGEQQMLAVGRALVLNPKIVLLDEPLEGLAPIIVEELLAALNRIIRQEGMSAILVEQNPQKILGVTDRAVILERGAIVHEAASAALARRPRRAGNLSRRHRPGSAAWRQRRALIVGIESWPARPGHPCLACRSTARKAWMPACAGMTVEGRCGRLPTVSPSQQWFTNALNNGKSD